MQYINKQLHADAANIVLNQFLEHCWIQEQEQYVNAHYYELCDSRYAFKDDLVDILLENQTSFCCYCMKEISTDETTLEHIIPHKTKTDYNRYLVCDELINHVIFAKIFDRLIRNLTPLQYPHDIAYYNLVASCDSTAHCNHRRSDKFIRPLFYNINIENTVDYDEQGYAYHHDYLSELSTTAISTDKSLIMYRRLWYYTAQLPIQEASDITEEVVKDIIAASITDVNFTMQLENFWGLEGSPSKYSEFKKYNWFFNYYRTKQ